MKKGLKHFAAGALLGGALLFGAAQASPELLPAETIFAVGINDANSAYPLLEPFVNEWVALGLGNDLELPAELGDANLLELLGESAWVGVSASGSNPIPTGIGLFRVSGEFRAFIEEMLAEVAAEEGTLTLTEGSHTFYLVEDEDDVMEGFSEGMAVSLTSDGLLAFATGSDAMRGILRRADGSAEPSFAGSPSYLAVSDFASDTVFTFVDFGRIGRIAAGFGRPFVEQLELGGLLDELESAFEAAGIFASGVRLTPEGIRGHGLQLVGDSSSPVRALLLERGTVSGDFGSTLPADTLSYGRSWMDAGGWWNWLNSLAASVPELGIGDLGEMLEALTGVNPERDIFSWLGHEVRTVMTDFPDSAGIGIASDSLLGSSVYILETSDEAAAQASLDNLFFMGSMMATSMLSLDGSQGMPEPDISELGGVSVTTYDFADGFSLSYGVADGHVYLATDAAALAAVLGGTGSGTDLERLGAEVPGNVAGFSVTDYSATIRASSEQLASQLGLFAGLSGEDLDFEMLEEYSAGLTAFFNFVADRTGGSWTYTRVDGNTVVSESFVEIDW